MVMNLQSDFYQISMLGLNVIVEAALKEATLILWIRSPDFAKQLYISENFMEVFRCPADNLFEQPHFVDRFVIREDFAGYKKNIDDRLLHPCKAQEKFTYFSIRNCDGDIRKTFDRSFPIFNRSGQQVAIAGIAGDITDHLNQNDCLPDMNNINNIMSEINHALSELKLTFCEPTSTNSEAVIPGKSYRFGELSLQFSKRQADCINLALKGKTAKEIARELNLSPRTVEEHLTIVKNKLDCLNKIQLISKVAKVLGESS